MPLLLICGLPSSGKSKIVQKIKELVENNKKNVKIISDTDFYAESEKNKIYSDNNCEKQIRSQIRAEVERYLPSGIFVCVDAANYIKGIVTIKEYKTTYCVIENLVPAEQAWLWNLQRPQFEQYVQQVFDELVRQFEPPSKNSRWEQPLLSLSWDINQKLPEDKILQLLFMKTPLKPSMSTLSSFDNNQNLQDVAKITDEIIQAIMNSPKTADTVKVNGSAEPIFLYNIPDLSKLLNLRRQFLKFLQTYNNKASPASLFVNYLNSHLAHDSFS